MKRRVYGILLFLCFVAPVTTNFIILQFQKAEVKTEVKKKLIAGFDREELVLLKLTEKEKQTQLNWRHNNKEFELNGEMYDVVETKVAGDTTYYWVWCDQEENRLNKQLDDLVSLALGNDPGNQENNKRLHKFFESLYFVEDTAKETWAFTAPGNQYPSAQKFYHSVDQSPPARPPEKA